MRETDRSFPLLLVRVCNSSNQSRRQITAQCQHSEGTLDFSPLFLQTPHRHCTRAQACTHTHTLVCGGPSLPPALARQGLLSGTADSRTGSASLH